MLLQEWNWDTAFQVQRQEGILNVISRMLKNLRPLSEIVRDTGLPESEIRAYAEQHNLPLSQ